MALEDKLMTWNQAIRAMRARRRPLTGDMYETPTHIQDLPRLAQGSQKPVIYISNDMLQQIIDNGSWAQLKSLAEAPRITRLIFQNDDLRQIKENMRTAETTDTDPFAMSQLGSGVIPTQPAPESGYNPLESAVRALESAPKIQNGGTMNVPPPQFGPPPKPPTLRYDEEVENSLMIKSPTIPRPGDRFGNWQIKEEIARGAMGAVYQAFHAEMGDQITYALKVILPDAARDQENRERFKREARAVAKIGNHPGIVQVHDLGTERDIDYLVMDFVPGKSLQEELKERRGPLTEVEAIDYTLQLAHALNHAHKNGVIHRDLKPANVIVDAQDGKLKLTDFGLARQAGNLSITSEGALLGTPMYMSPEQAQGQRADQRSDICGLGAILYHLTTGIPPYSAENLTGLLIKVIGEESLPEEQLNPELSPKIIQIRRKMTAKKREDRYQNMQEVIYDLESHIEQDTRELEQELKITRRSFSWGALLGIGALILGGGGGTSYWIHLRSQKTKVQNLIKQGYECLKNPFEEQTDQAKTYFNQALGISPRNEKALKGIKNADAINVRNDFFQEAERARETDDWRKAVSAIPSLLKSYQTAERQLEEPTQQAITLSKGDGASLEIRIQTTGNQPEATAYMHNVVMNREGRYEKQKRRQLETPTQTELQIGNYMVEIQIGEQTIWYHAYLERDLGTTLQDSRCEREQATIDLPETMPNPTINLTTQQPGREPQTRTIQKIDADWDIIPAGQIYDFATGRGRTNTKEKIEVDQFIVTRKPISCREYSRFLIEQKPSDRARHMPQWIEERQSLNWKDLYERTHFPGAWQG